MKKLKLRDGLLAIEKLRKASGQKDGFFASVEDTQHTGRVEYAAVGLEMYLGKEVVFGPKHEAIRVTGKELLFMELDNVFAEVEEEIATPTATTVSK